MKFDIDYVEKLAKVLSNNSLTEISLEDGEQAITIRKEAFGVTANVAPVAAQQIAVQAPQEKNNAEPARKGTPLTSPMVGTFYSAPAPDAEPLLKSDRL